MIYTRMSKYVIATLLYNYYLMVHNTEIVSQKFQAHRLGVIVNHMNKNYPRGSHLWVVFISLSKAVEDDDIFNEAVYTMALIDIIEKVNAKLNEHRSMNN